MKKFIKNKKGFTLVELVVCVAILGLISITVIGLMTTGTNMFTNVQKRAMVMFKSESASVQIKDFLQNASGFITENEESDGDKQLIFSDKNNLYLLIFDADDKEIYLGTLTKDQVKSIKFDKNFSVDSIAADDILAPLSYNVSNLSYKIYSDEETNVVSSIKFYITTTRLGQEYTRGQVVSLRGVVKEYPYDEEAMDSDYEEETTAADGTTAEKEKDDLKTAIKKWAYN